MSSVANSGAPAFPTTLTITAGVVQDGTNSSTQTQKPRTPTAVRPFIMSTSEERMLSGDDLDDHYSCLVCLEFFTDGELMYELPCHHRYHRRCVRKWVIQKRECPKCFSVLPSTPSTAASSPRAMTLCSRKRWEKDELVRQCRGCRVSFTFFTRKHHCRSCGRIFCSNCCPNEGIPVIGDGFRNCQECRETARF